MKHWLFFILMHVQIVAKSALTMTMSISPPSMSRHPSVRHTALSCVEVTSIHPAACWLQSSVKNNKDLGIKEIVYVPSKISVLACDESNSVSDDEHWVSLLVDKGFVVHTLGYDSPKTDLVKAISQVVNWYVYLRHSYLSP